MMDVEHYNRDAWNHQVETHCRWTQPVDAGRIEAARQGNLQLLLTPRRTIPQDWLPHVPGARILCLASGGGQQAPLLAAAGADVTVLDQSLGQLGQDVRVADREGLRLTAVQGEMKDLTMFPEQHFDLVLHPCSISFVPDVAPVWRQVARVLRPGGNYLLGFCNPLVFLFDLVAMEAGRLEVRHSIPYSDLTDLPPEQLQMLRDRHEPLCFGHSLEAILGGLLSSGFQLTGLYEDLWESGPERILDAYIPSTMAIRAERTAENR